MGNFKESESVQPESQMFAGADELIRTNVLAGIRSMSEAAVGEFESTLVGSDMI